MSTQTAYFAAGCFWGVEEKFRSLQGVIETEVGYSGGKTESPTYEEVCSGETGHAESLRIEFDPNLTSFEKLTRFFFEIHDPTQINRQGPDTGSQYRSAIFFLNEDQKKQAEELKNEIDRSEKYSDPIATEISPAQKFWPAEDYHQKYILKKNQAAEA